MEEKSGCDGELIVAKDSFNAAPNQNPINIYKITDMNNSLIKNGNLTCQFSSNNILEELNRDTQTSLSINLNFNLNDENVINIEVENNQNLIIEGAQEDQLIKIKIIIILIKQKWYN